MDNVATKECFTCGLTIREERLTKVVLGEETSHHLCIQCMKDLFDPDFYLGKKVKRVRHPQGK